MRKRMRTAGGLSAAVVLASGIAISSTALGAGMVPAGAEPVTTTTYAPAPTYAPTTTYAPEPTQAPATTYAPATEAPAVTTVAPTTEAPAVTTEAPQVTTQAPVITTTAAPAITTTAAPAITTTAAPAITTTAAPASTTTAALPTATTALSTATSALPTTTGPLPTGTSALPTTTGPLPTGTSLLPTAALTTKSAVLPTPTTVVAAQVTPTETPKTLEAVPQNLQVAKDSVPAEVNPTAAPQSEIQQITNKLNSQVSSAASATPSLAAEQTSNVKQFPLTYVDYDQYYRPRIINPFPDPLQIVYIVAGAPRIVVIPPLASAITEIATVGAYNFTAMVLNTVGAATSVAVGTMMGGGVAPAPGQPAPPPPPPVQKLNDVPVQVKYSNATYQPFVVKQIIDAGLDPAVGETKVLLDGITPAWGSWVTNENGQRQFEIHKTQQYPGLDDPPAEGPLPGDYKLQLASASKPASSGLSTRDLLLIAGAGLVLVLGLGAIVLNVMLGRRRPHHH